MIRLLPILLWLAGVTATLATPHAIVPSDLCDNDTGRAVSGTVGGAAYYTTNCFARLLLTTSGRLLTVRVACDAGHDTLHVGVRSGGVDQEAINPMGAGLQTVYFLLPVGSNKTVELIVSARDAATAGGAAGGVNLVDVDCDAPYTLTAPPASPTRIVFIGDSITAGGNPAGARCLLGWVPLMRPAYSGSLLCDAWGYRRLADGVNASAVAALNPSKIWIALGTNDYGLNTYGSAANFGAAYAAALDALHAAAPSAMIYAQTPILRASEPANANGWTLADARTQISTAQSGRASWCTLVSGPALLTTAGLSSDGLHPSTAGNVTYAASVRAILGF